jgi:hypothetical protein
VSWSRAAITCRAVVSAVREPRSVLPSTAIARFAVDSAVAARVLSQSPIAAVSRSGSRACNSRRIIASDGRRSGSIPARMRSWPGHRRPTRRSPCTNGNRPQRRRQRHSPQPADDAVRRGERVDRVNGPAPQPTRWRCPDGHRPVRTTVQRSAMMATRPWLTSGRSQGVGTRRSSERSWPPAATSKRPDTSSSPHSGYRVSFTTWSPKRRPRRETTTAVRHRSRVTYARPSPRVGRRTVRPDPALRHPRTRHRRHPQRHRPAGPDPPVRRHVPGLQRLHFGASADYQRLYQEFGITPRGVAHAAVDSIGDTPWALYARGGSQQAVSPTVGGTGGRPP